MRIIPDKLFSLDQTQNSSSHPIKFCERLWGGIWCQLIRNTSSNSQIKKAAAESEAGADSVSRLANHATSKGFFGFQETL